MTLDDEGRSSAGREVARFIPVPTSVSEQAQQFLGMDMFGGGPERVVPRAIAGWRALIKETDELLVAVMGTGRTPPLVRSVHIGRWSSRIRSHS